MKHNNIHIMGTPEEKRVSKELRSYLKKKMTKKFPKLVKQKDIRVQEVRRVLNKMDPKKPTPRHIIIKMAKLKDKEKILTATEEKQVVTYKEAPDRLSSDFSTNISGQNGRA